MNNIQLSNLQKCNYSLKYETGLFREFPVSFMLRADTKKKNIDIIKNILSIILTSDNISMASKIYITNFKISIRNTNEILNDLNEEASRKTGKHIKHVGYTNTLNALANDDKAIAEALGENTILDLVYNRVNYKVENDRLLNNIIKRFGNCDNKRSNLLLDFSHDVFRYNKYKGSEEFFEILEGLRPYLVQQRDKAEDTISRDIDFIGYFNYLLSSKAILDPKLNKDRERLLRFLNNEDIGCIKKEINTLEIEDSLASTKEVDTLEKLESNAEKTYDTNLDSNEHIEEIDNDIANDEQQISEDTTLEENKDNINVENEVNIENDNDTKELEITENSEDNDTDNNVDNSNYNNEASELSSDNIDPNDIIL